MSWFSCAGWYRGSPSARSAEAAGKNKGDNWIINLYTFFSVMSNGDLYNRIIKLFASAGCYHQSFIYRFQWSRSEWSDTIYDGSGALNRKSGISDLYPDPFETVDDENKFSILFHMKIQMGERKKSMKLKNCVRNYHGFAHLKQKTFLKDIFKLWVKRGRIRILKTNI